MAYCLHIGKFCICLFLNFACTLQNPCSAACKFHATFTLQILLFLHCMFLAPCGIQILLIVLYIWLAPCKSLRRYLHSIMIPTCRILRFTIFTHITHFYAYTFPNPAFADCKLHVTSILKNSDFCCFLLWFKSAVVWWIQMNHILACFIFKGL